MKTTNERHPSVAQHLDDADLISHLDGELTREKQEYARAHLESCWSCRSQLRGIQDDIENFLRVRKQALPAELPPAGPAITQFRHRLAQHVSAPKPLSQNLTYWLRIPFWQEPMAGFFNLIFKSKKAALSTALAGVVLLVALVDPFEWNSASADELLDRAAAYELLHESGNGKVVRSRVRIERIALGNGFQRKVSEVETARDNLSSAIYISEQSASGVTRRHLIPDRYNAASAFIFGADFSSQMAAYLTGKGWLPQVSVSSYRRLITDRGMSGEDGAFAVHRGETYELHHLFARAHASGITETLLVLNAKDYSPQAISIITGEKEEAFEYEITRLSHESVERTPEIAGLFEVSKPEERSAVNPKIAPESAKRDMEPRGVVSTPVSPVATAQIEVEVLGLLSQIDADLGQEVIVTRLPGGALRVEAVVDTDERKREILATLSAVANNPAVTIAIETSSEAQERARSSQTTGAPTAITSEMVASNTIAVEPQVRQYLLDRGVQQQLIETEVGRVANQIVARSHRAMLHVWALKSLAHRFSAAELKTLDDDAHAKWLQMISNHARRFQGEASALHKEIAIILNTQPVAADAQLEIADEEHLIRAVTQLIATASFNHEVIRSAFTVSARGGSTSAITTPQFWRSMSLAATTAASIKSATQRLK